MKLNMKKIARRIFPVVTAVVILISMSFSASAETIVYNLNDFVTNVDIDGENDLMSVVIPRKLNRWHSILNGSSSNYIKGQPIYNLQLKSDWLPDEEASINEFSVVYLPFGGGNYFDVSSLPISTSFTLQNVVLYFVLNNGQGFNTDVFQNFSVQYYDENYKYISTQWIDKEYTFTPGNVETFTYNLEDITFTLDKPKNAKFALFRMILNFDAFYFHQNYSTLSVDIGDFVFDMRISSAYREMLQAEENSRLMNEINNQLAEQNKTMEDILNGTPEQNEQISGAVGEMGSAGDKLGDLSDQMQVEHPDASNMNVSINSFIPETSLLAYTGPILAFWENDSLQAMLIIVLTLVLVSWVMFGKKG